MKMSKRARDSIRGYLEVTPIDKSELGCSGIIATAGMLGYVAAARDGLYLVVWPCLKTFGVHEVQELKATGNRG